MKRRKLTTLAVLAIIVAATYLATSQPIGPVGIRYVQTDSSLTGSGVTANTLKVNTTNIQARVTGTCTSPNAIRVVNNDGTVTCTTGVIDTAGSGLSSSGSTIYANMGGASCANGSAVTAISGSGVGTCTIINTLTGVGDITGVTAGSGLSGGGTSGAVTVAVGAGSGILAAGAVTSTNIGAGLTYSSGAIIPNLAGASCGAGSAVSAISSAGTGTCTGLISGTSGRSTRFTSATAIGNGAFTDGGTNASIAGTFAVNVSNASAFSVNTDDFWVDSSAHSTNTNGALNVAGNTTLGNEATDAITFSNGPTGVNLYGGQDAETTDEFCDAINGSLPTISKIGHSYILQFSGTGAGLTTKTIASGHPCVAALTIGVGTAGNATSLLSDPGAIKFGASNNYTFEWHGQWPTLSSASSSATSMYTSEIGFTDSAGTPNAVNGCYFAYDKGNALTGNKNAGNVDALECWCASASTRTGYLINNSGNSDETFALGVGTVAAATYYGLKVTVTGTTRAEFYRDSGAGFVKVCDINTNLPSAAVGFGMAHFPQATTGTGARSLETDQTVLRWHLGSPRSP